MAQNKGVPASPSGHSRAEPEEVSALRASVPNAVIFARANEIASERYPLGGNATQLADVLRDACRELGLMRKRGGSPRPLNPNAGRTCKLSALPESMRSEIIQICRVTTTANGGGDPCVMFGHACYRCQDLAASAIEAATAGETAVKLGSTEEELIERLRRKAQRFPAMGGGTIGVDASGKATSSSYITDDGYRLVNPDGPVAADRLEYYRSDRAKLEERVREFCAIIDKTEHEGFTPEIEQELLDLNRSTDRG